MANSPAVVSPCVPSLCVMYSRRHCQTATEPGGPNRTPPATWPQSLPFLPTCRLPCQLALSCQSRPWGGGVGSLGRCTGAPYNGVCREGYRCSLLPPLHFPGEKPSGVRAAAGTLLPVEANRVRLVATLWEQPVRRCPRSLHSKQMIVLLPRPEDDEGSGGQMGNTQGYVTALPKVVDIDGPRLQQPPSLTF